MSIRTVVIAACMAALVPSVCLAQAQNNPIPGIDVVVKKQPPQKLNTQGSGPATSGTQATTGATLPKQSAGSGPTSAGAGAAPR